jgi:splicing factor U2AF subunit
LDDKDLKFTSWQHFLSASSELQLRHYFTDPPPFCTLHPLEQNNTQHPTEYQQRERTRHAANSTYTSPNMANYLASIFGTEQDKVNCSFYYKIGACRHGDRCSRKHVKPSYSQTILLPNLYQNPAYDNKSRLTPSQLQNHFDAFYEDFWCEMCKYGEVEEVVVCDNNNDHLIGNVYARFKYEDSAQAACDALNSRWYAARPIYCELSPVTDFREACCRLNSGEGCVRGGFCNFIHRKEPSPELERDLELSTKKWLRGRGRDERSMSRSPSPEPANPRF